jgi:hypothetical protein
VGGGSGTASGYARRGSDTSSLPRFLDGSLDDAIRAFVEEEALGFTFWLPEAVVLGFFSVPRLMKFLADQDLY